MASITIRRLPERVKSRLRVRAARHGHSMEQEARAILQEALAAPESPLQNLAAFLRTIWLR